MPEDPTQISLDTRRAERVQMNGAVTIRFATDAIRGSGQNVSTQGVFFQTEGRVPVTITIEGRDEELTGELVRVESMGTGQVGIAVKFDAPHDDLVAG